MDGTLSLTQPAVRCENVTLAYDRHPAVHHLNGSFRLGSLTAIIGPNGAGKSTLLKALVGQIPIDAGRIDLAGLSRADIAYMPQQAAIDRSFPISVADVVTLGHWPRIGGFRRMGAVERRSAEGALVAVGLEGFARRPIGNLSTGQLQRVLFARLLLQDARLILLDEPFNAIDARTTADLLGVVKRWHGEQRTIIAVLHDLELVADHFPETLLLAREPIAWGATELVLTPANQLRARAMAERWRDDAEVCERRPA